MGKRVRAVYYNPGLGTDDVIRAIRNEIGAGKVVLGNSNQEGFPILYVNGKGEIDTLREREYILIDPEEGASTWDSQMVEDFWDLIATEDDFVTIRAPKMTDWDKIMEIIEDIDRNNSWYSITEEQASEITDAIIAAGFKRG